MTGADWIGAHLFCHGDLDDLLLRAVVPLADELAGAGLVSDDWFYLRYWDGGPHVRFRVKPAAPAARAEIRDVIADRIERYFRGSPAPDRLDQERYARTAEIMARREGVRDYSRRLRPNNSLAFIPYRRESGRYGHGAAIEAAEAHFCASSRITLGVLARTSSPDRRAAAAYAMILLAWFASSPDPRSLTGLIRTDAPAPDEAAGAAGQAAGAVGEAAGAVGEKARAMLDTGSGWALATARHVRRLLSGAGDLEGDGALIAWTRSMCTLRDALAAEIAAGRFDPPAEGWPADGGIAAGGGGAPELPVLDICAHLACNRLGIRAGVESLLRRLAADAVASLAEEATLAEEERQRSALA